VKAIKFILLFLGTGFIVIQFMRPPRNNNPARSVTDLEAVYPVPEAVVDILKRSCYDCHSNVTRYPWYTDIQPVGWLLSRHIREGKKELNFSEFGSYSDRKRQSKVRAIETSISDGTMPLPSYTWMHKNAKLTQQEKKVIYDWLQKLKVS
jgi:hypothetical protein